MVNLMLITNYYNIKYPTANKYNKSCTKDCKNTNSINFTANINSISEKKIQKCEYALRFIVNRIIDLFESKKIKKITKNISEIVPEANEKYLEKLEEISTFFSTSKDIDVNIEDKILEKIAKNDQSVIFIMNHSNQKKDPTMLAVLNLLLSRAYKENRKTQNFPLPKIVLNQDILKTMNQTKRKAFEAFGAVGIDANIYTADKKVNAKVFLPLIKDFVQNKSNIFIFPEGKLAIRTDLDFNKRFQPGIAELINKVLGIKKEVTVVPVGFSYGKGKNKKLTGMHIGEPLKFMQKDNLTIIAPDSRSEYTFDGFKSFLNKDENGINITIIKNATSGKTYEVTDYIKNLLAEKLDNCSKEACKQIQNNAKSDEIILI